MSSENQYEQLVELQSLHQRERALIEQHKEEYCSEGKASPLEEEGLVSRIFFNWVNPLLQVIISFLKILSIFD